MERDPTPTLRYIPSINFSHFYREIYCYGYRYQTSTQIVIYSQPTSQHFFWPEAIKLDLKGNSGKSDLTELEEALQQVTKINST